MYAEYSGTQLLAPLLKIRPWMAAELTQLTRQQMLMTRNPGQSLKSESLPFDTL